MNYTTPKITIVLMKTEDVLTSSTDGYTSDYFDDKNWMGGDK